MVLGPDHSNIVSSFVEFDDTRYEVESPLRAIDVCFKVYQALHAAYPPESKVMWTVVQRLVYGITTQWDEETPSLLKAIAELED